MFFRLNAFAFLVVGGINYSIYDNTRSSVSYLYT